MDKPSGDNRLAAALEAMNKASSSGKGITTDKIVASIVMLVVTCSCLWVGTTLNGVSRTVIELQLESKHMTDSVAELKVEVKNLRMNGSSAQNSAAISLINERMANDDDREDRDIVTFNEIEKRLTLLESKGTNGG